MPIDVNDICSIKLIDRTTGEVVAEWSDFPLLESGSCTCYNGDDSDFYQIYKNEDDKWVLSIEGQFDYNCGCYNYEEIEITYCPFCGRKLK